jgi:hypothetical protein
VYDGVRRFREIQDEEPHVVPSASGTAACVKQNVYTGRRVPRTNEVPVQSIIKMDGGVRMEDFWFDVLHLANFDLESHPESIPYEEGIPDLIPGAADGLTPEYIVELKNLGVWGYIGFVQKGLKDSDYGYYAQVQAYMHDYKRERAVLLAGMADSSAVKWVWQKIKRQDSIPPPFWLEIVDYDPDALKRAQESARTVDYFVRATDIPMKDVPRIWHEGSIVDPASVAEAGKMPCGYCGWLQACLKGE